LADIEQNEQTHPEISPQSVLAGILSSGIELFTDATGVPRLRRPNDAPEDLAWPVDSETAIAHLSKLAYETHKLILKGSDVAGIVRILKGYALENVQRDVAAYDLIERDPVLRALIRLLNTSPTWRGPAARLLVALRSEVLDEGIDFNREPSWPKDPARLSCRLRELSPVLERLGIRHVKSRTGRQRTHSLERFDDLPPSSDEPASPSSLISSSPNSIASSPLPQQDGSDDRSEDFAQCTTP
jgi:hypothetical protein